jgi:pimeloyl-ACP methyl ester carboxylesterase
MQVGYRNCEAVLPSVHVPTLVLHRTGDLIVPVGQGRRMAEGIPNATFTELPGNDHLMWVGDQGAVVDRIAPSSERTSSGMEAARSGPQGMASS